MSRNIDQFNEAVGKIFAKLYSEFPNEITLQISEFTHEDLDKYKTEVDVFVIYQLEGHAMLVNRSIAWLIEEGYIKGEPNKLSQLDFSDCRLTNKGFVALGAIPDSLHSTETIGDQLVDIAKDTAIQQGKDAFGSLVKTVLALGSSCITGP
ncbi:hypothetical protein [Marinomonas atlantica]|uniref:hypothetical protein n=1 Tax=Marinomonas atlantica TaxID=1806668 RepID=UPI00082D727F|nr:hypothetical protein [Marinomonas atlantica]